ncbi:10919_t:CDS:1 [Diversispora eburnea]|uniref:10919_t:CDS:1 n=1 Tax=Diversispora eburnea TaxID=1213867 RepID=A0A9N8UZ02_9GLOM|nr:10919_t:CDS:1 [Diversispora eburnea]
MSNEKEFEQINDNDIVIPKKPHYPPTIKPQDLLPKNSNSGKLVRMPNAFIVYRIVVCQCLRSQNICITMPDASSLASEFWAHEPIYVKATYKKIASEAKLLYDKQLSSNDNNNKEELKEMNFKESKKSKKSSSVVVEPKNENMEFTTATTAITAENLNSELISFSSQNIYHPQQIQEFNFHNYVYNNYNNYNDYNNNYNYNDYNDYNKYNNYNNNDYDNYYVCDNQIYSNVYIL